jgi:hypothetical protein
LEGQDVPCSRTGNNEGVRLFLIIPDNINLLGAFLVVRCIVSSPQNVPELVEIDDQLAQVSPTLNINGFSVFSLCLEYHIPSPGAPGERKSIHTVPEHLLVCVQQCVCPCIVTNSGRFQKMLECNSATAVRTLA